MATASILGFTGFYLDSITAAYPLGNGNRWFSPGLMRFNAPDNLSPFGAGGINPYVYCADDPINRSDPSGHMPLGVAKAVEDGAAAAGEALESAGRSTASVQQQFSEAFNRAENMSNETERLKNYQSIIEHYGHNEEISAFDRANVHWNAAVDSMSLAESHIQIRAVTTKRPSPIRSLKYVEDAISHMSQAKALYTSAEDKSAAQDLINEYETAKNRVTALFTADLPDYQGGRPSSHSPSPENPVTISERPRQTRRNPRDSANDFIAVHLIEENQSARPRLRTRGSRLLSRESYLGEPR